MNQNEILQAIQEATKGQPADDRCFTVPDLMKASQASKERTSKERLRMGCEALVVEGKLEHARFSKRSAWGTWCPVNGFRIVAKPNGKKK